MAEWIEQSANVCSMRSDYSSHRLPHPHPNTPLLRGGKDGGVWGVYIQSVVRDLCGRGAICEGFKKTVCEGDTQQREASSPADSEQTPGLDSVTLKSSNFTVTCLSHSLIKAIDQISPRADRNKIMCKL